MRSLPQHWYEALIWLSYALVGLVFSVVLSLVVLLATQVRISIGSFTDGGQFALYSASMWGTVFYVIARPTPWRLYLTEWFLLVTVLGILFSAAFFLVAVLYSNGFGINPAVVRWPTIALFVVSAGLTYVAKAKDNERMELNIQKRQRSEGQALAEDFDRTAER